MIVAAKSIKTSNEIKEIIASKFELQDLGEIKFYLGIEIIKDAKNIYHLCQSKYIQRIASDFGLSDAKVSNVPMNVNYDKSDANDNFLLTNTDYQKLIGCLLYISVNTRPDISASVSILAQRVQQPRQQDWDELKRVLKYLKGTANVKLALSSDDDSDKFFYGYADANWAENKEDRKSNTGYIFIVNGGIVSWACRKQNSVALSSTEAEFIALSEACQEAFWLRRLLNDLQQPVQTATTIYEDNQSCLKLIEEEKFSNRTKHVDTRYHFVKDYVQRKFVSCVYCCSEDMLADLLTKPLPTKRHIMLRKRCGLN